MGAVNSGASSRLCCSGVDLGAWISVYNRRVRFMDIGVLISCEMPW